MNIYVGNLHPNISETQLMGLFKPYGRIVNVKLIMDLDTGLSKGFGFVEMQENDDAQKAIRELHDTETMGQKIQVEEAQPRPVVDNEFLVKARAKKSAQNSNNNSKRR